MFYRFFRRIFTSSGRSIDIAEDRERFQKLLQQLKLKQPPNALATSVKDAYEKAETLGFPIVIRPSYVLGGAGMEIVQTMEEMQRYITNAVRVSGSSPVLLDRYLSGAVEVDVDVLSDGEDVYVTGVMEHIEEAGIHSGDSACVLPPHSLPYKTVREIEKQSEKLARALKVNGLMNVQFAVKLNVDTGENEIFIIEVNPRASRTVPFVAKATGVPIAKIAARLMAGEKLSVFRKTGMLKGMTTDRYWQYHPV